MIKAFHFKKELKTSRSIFIQTEASTPLELMVVKGKRHIIGVAELGNESATIEKPIAPFLEPPKPEEVAKELLKKLKVPESEWDEILKTKREIAV